jgi:hypothetical protein
MSITFSLSSASIRISKTRAGACRMWPRTSLSCRAHRSPFCLSDKDIPFRLDFQPLSVLSQIKLAFNHDLYRLHGIIIPPALSWQSLARRTSCSRPGCIFCGQCVVVLPDRSIMKTMPSFLPEAVVKNGGLTSRRASKTL